MTPTTTQMITVTSFDALGNFGKYGWLAALIVTVSITGLYWLGRWAGIRGIHWLWPNLFSFITGEIAFHQQRALSGYLILLGIIGATITVILAMRRNTIPT